MIKGIIIYSPEDIDKNKKFVNICKDIMGKNGINLELVVLEDKEQKDIFGCMDNSCNLKYADKDIISFAINRSRNHYIAKQLEAQGVQVFNNSFITEIANDKFKTYEFSKELGIDVMETWQGSNIDDCKIAYPRVVKSCYGHGGSEVFLVNDEEEEKKAVDKISGPFIVQKLADAKGRDIRVYVIGDEIVVAMCRSAVNGFKSNFSLGGKAETYELNAKELDIVNKIVSEVKPDYIGIDLMYHGEKVVLNELEDAVGARMVYENTDISIIEMYAKYIVKISNIW